MTAFPSQSVEADLHRLELRFAALRVPRPRAVEALARSLEVSGQLTPVVAVAGERWVLVDGYLRVAALHRCGWDRVQVMLWQCSVAEALLAVLAQGQGRRWEAIEEAALVRELHRSLACSQRAIARQVGRDVSWVHRRLALIEAVATVVLDMPLDGGASAGDFAVLTEAIALPRADLMGVLLDTGRVTCGSRTSPRKARRGGRGWRRATASSPWGTSPLPTWPTSSSTCSTSGPATRLPSEWSATAWKARCSPTPSCSSSVPQPPPLASAAGSTSGSTSRIPARISASSRALARMSLMS
jgi:hypothetical protein